ncbi:MAG: glycosyltransferase family 2 protein [Pseudomonadota bacterium]
MDLSVIIVNFRAWRHLRECLDSLRYLATESPKTEIIVVDNRSDDGELDQFSAAYPWVQWVENGANRGFAGGCNLGARSATGQCLLFLNPDCIDRDQAIADVWRTAGEKSQITTVTQQGEDGSPRKVGGDFAPWWGLGGPGRLALSVLRHMPGRRVEGRLDWVSGSFLMIPRGTFDLVGGWDEQFFMYSEDVDLCRRSRDAGISCRLLNDFSIIHHHGGASRSSAELRAMTRAEVTISHHRFCAKHFRGMACILGHTQLWLFRALPALLASVVLPSSTTGRIGRHLRRFYRRVTATGSWESPRISEPPKL